MGKRSKVFRNVLQASVIVVIFALSAIIYTSSAFSLVENPEPPRANIYGFEILGPNPNSFIDDYITIYAGEQNYVANPWRRDPASGIETLFEGGYPANPSTHKALCYDAWGSWYHSNESAVFAYNQLYGDAFFEFFGHGLFDPQGRGGHALMFYTPSGTTYLLDKPRAGDGISGTKRYLINLKSSGQSEIDDMKFALLNACYSAMEWQGDKQHLTWMMRCYLGVDTVIGFTGDTGELADWGNGYYGFPSHAWNECFMRSTMLEHKNVGEAEGIATGLMVPFYGNPCGMDTNQIWGDNSAYLYTPTDGVRGY